MNANLTNALLVAVLIVVVLMMFGVGVTPGNVW